MLRVVPLLFARRLPDRVAAYAEHAGVAVLAAIVVRAVVLHQNPDVPGAPLVALTPPPPAWSWPTPAARRAGDRHRRATYVAITAALTGSL